MRKRSYRRRRIAQLLALVSTFVGVLVFVTSGVSNADVTPITEYATYPPTLPSTCGVTGADVVVNERFTSGGTTVTDLRNLAPAPGATITMTWESFVPGCQDVGVGLSSKVASLPFFDGSADYWLHQFAYCGPEAGATPCSGPPFSLSVQVPTTDQAPCYQIDAHLGPPLAQVGPAAAYYGILNGVRNLLVSALNAGQGACVPLPPCATNPQVPASAYLCTGSSTSVPPTEPPPTTTPPTEPPTTPPPTPTTVTAPGQPPCSVNPQLPADSPECVVCATNPSLPASSPDCVSVQGTQLAQCEAPLVRDAATNQCVSLVTGSQLPLTGRSSGSLVVTGALLLLAGLCIAYAYGRERPLV